MKGAVQGNLAVVHQESYYEWLNDQLRSYVGHIRWMCDIERAPLDINNQGYVHRHRNTNFCGSTPLEDGKHRAVRIVMEI